MLNVRTPHGTVLSPFLFPLYKSDFQHSSDSCHLQKFFDDLGCSVDGQELEHRTLIADVVEWCLVKHLLLKELVYDFKRERTPVQYMTIQGSEVDIVFYYKYLEVYVDRRLDSKDNCNTV